MDERTLRRRIEAAAARGLIDRKTRKLTRKGWTLVTRYHVVGNPLTPDPRRVPQDDFRLAPAEKAVVAKFDARRRPLNQPARRSARAEVKTKKVRPARCRIRDVGQTCGECGRLITAWAVCPVTGEQATGNVPVKTPRR